MHICELFKKKTTFSLEVFPPKAEQPLEPVLETLDRLYAYKPDFVSCTYGAGGKNKGRNLEICRAILESGKTEAVTHFTCIGNTRADIDRSLDEYRAAGIANMLAMRGDLPEGWEGTRGDFAHADGLIAYIKARCPALCLAAACYPEKHIQAPSMEADIAYLRGKQDSGAELLMSQLCHDVPAFERFLARIRKAGVTLPVVVGLMPVLSKDAIIRMTLMNGCSIPAELAALIGKYGEDPAAFKAAGKEYTAKQMFRYIDAGANGLHIYTLNRHQDVADILDMSGLRSAVKE